ncbi:hypothetical protein [Fodinicurvata sp. EGI_FJ10296]|uniref:hypothetical protein n=1 Tax=Fodinicurvata sp. EGI_FJ10296 TaxID=3231908 RepID=UPI003453CE7A
MPEPDETRIRLLEESLRDLRNNLGPTVVNRQPRPIDPSPIAGRIDAAEKTVERIVSAGVLKDQEAGRFKDLASAAINDQVREIMRGGTGDVAATINVTVSGTGTISVS